MDFITSDRLLKKWKQKLVAILMAYIIWVFVSHSITATKTVAGVTVRIVNLPPEKAIEGLLPNGVSNKRIALTLTGTKEVIDHIEPGDLEVVLDAAHAPDEWIVQITKKNLVSLNPEIDISRDIRMISHLEFIVDLDKMITAKIPVTIMKPNGKAPAGYEYLGIWPRHLMQNVTGPKSAIQQLHAKGLEFTFDLSEISKDDLDAIQAPQSGYYNDEISYLVPDIWKKISIPFLNKSHEPFNDPKAENLRIEFLRKEYILINRKIPLRVFYPMQNISEINPISHPVKKTHFISQVYDITVLNTPLLAYGVSHLFVDIVRDHLELILTAEPKEEKESLPWNLEYIDQQNLESKFIAFLAERHELSELQNDHLIEQRKSQWQERFREYMNQLKLFLAPNHPLILDCKLESDGIAVEQE